MYNEEAIMAQWERIWYDPEEYDNWLNRGINYEDNEEEDSDDEDDKEADCDA